LRSTFRSLRNPNYRIWAAGALVSNIGTWMQRTAQDWIVLTELTDRNATSMGIVMGLQFGPQLLMLPLTGYAADHFNRRKLIFCTQVAMGLLALGLGLLTVTGLVKLWHVYIFAFLLGCAAAFDAPARQTFVAELVEERDLPNAVGLNSTSFNAARMFGPALAGLLISAVGSGWVFLINAVSFLAVLGSLVALRPHRLRPTQRAVRTRGSFAEGFRYVLRRSDLKLILFMLFVISTFGLNFTIFISTMAVKVFGTGAGQYGLLTSMLAAGSVTGALMTAARAKPSIAVLLVGALMFAAGCTAAALMPSYFLFGAMLFVIGISVQTLTTTTSTLVQTSTEPAMRGRVIAILMAIIFGGTPIGSPIAGWIADHFGPRWALGVGSLSGLVAALAAVIYLARTRNVVADTKPAKI
jgi:MFS family permease